MSIMWKYLDKRSATIAAIKDYESMQFIINSTDDEIKRTYEKMTLVSRSRFFWDMGSATSSRRRTSPCRFMKSKLL